MKIKMLKIYIYDIYVILKYILYYIFVPVNIVWLSLMVMQL